MMLHSAIILFLSAPIFCLVNVVFPVITISPLNLNGTSDIIITVRKESGKWTNSECVLLTIECAVQKSLVIFYPNTLVKETNNRFDAVNINETSFKIVGSLFNIQFDDLKNILTLEYIWEFGYKVLLNKSIEIENKPELVVDWEIKNRNDKHVHMYDILIIYCDLVPQSDNITFDIFLPKYIEVLQHICDYLISRCMVEVRVTERAVNSAVVCGTSYLNVTYSKMFKLYQEPENKTKNFAGLITVSAILFLFLLSLVIGIKGFLITKKNRKKFREELFEDPLYRTYKIEAMSKHVSRISKLNKESIKSSPNKDNSETSYRESFFDRYLALKNNKSKIRRDLREMRKFERQVTDETNESSYLSASSRYTIE